MDCPTTTLKLSINGHDHEVSKTETLKNLLDSLRINPNAVVLEYNQAVINREEIDKIQLRNGDCLEIVHFVGGGAGKKKKPEVEEGLEEQPPAVAEVKAPKRAKTVKASPKKVSKASSGPRNLVIVESPAKAKTINKYLGNDFQVEASMGHVRDLPKSKMGVDIENNFSPHYIVMKKAQKTVKHLKLQAKGKEGIFLAPDPDREGEAISWHLAHIFSEQENHPQIQRVVFNEITKDAILEAFRHPREIKTSLVDAQQARRILDRIVGYELSPLLWKKVGRGLSAGRVQSVALRMIVDRENEIKVFVPQEYWSLEVRLSSEKSNTPGKVFTAKLDKIGTEKAELVNGEQTEKIRQELSAAAFQVNKLEKRERSRYPQAPFTTSKLQQEAYNRLGFPAAKTMRIAQKLYEGVELGSEGTVGLITYMRTDSVTVSASAQTEVSSYIQQKFGAPYLPAKPPVYKSKKGAQEAHEAIRPTAVLREPEMMRSFLEDDAFLLYELIWRKFVASQMTPALDEQMTIIILGGEKYFFKATGRRNLFPGFDLVYQAFAKDVKAEKEEGEEDASADLPELQADEMLKMHELTGNQHFTKPPARYNDASLVKLLEEKGIGRPSTYAPTIYTLLSRDYVSRKGGALIPTDMGVTVAELLVKHFPKILDVQFTANMEEEFDKIEEGTVDWIEVLRRFFEPFKIDMAQAREEMKNIRQEVVVTEYICDVCGKPMVIRWGRFGKFMACSGFPECKYTRSMPTGFHCPQPDCKGDLVRRMSKNRRTFYGCSSYPKCNYVAYKLPVKEETPGSPEAALEKKGPSDDDKLSETESVDI